MRGVHNMNACDLCKTRHELESVAAHLELGLDAAQERLSRYYKERYSPAENDPAIEDDEWDAIQNTYDDLWGIYEDFKLRWSIAKAAAEAMLEAEGALEEAEVAGVWKRG
jgi:hypothetical protein